MKYFDYLFPYEIIARQYGDIKKQYEEALDTTEPGLKAEVQGKIDEAEASYENYWNKAESFVSSETSGRGEPDDLCPPPKRPPCRWPDKPCDSDGLVCIDAKYIENIDLVFPKSDTDSYTIVIKHSGTKNIVVDYIPYTNEYRFFKYQASAGLLPGVKYEFEIIVDAGIGAITIITYPFKITP